MKKIFKKELGPSVSRMSIWRTLKQFEYSYRKPEARFYHINKNINSEEWQKKSVPKIKRLVKK